MLYIYIFIYIYIYSNVLIVSIVCKIIYERVLNAQGQSDITTTIITQVTS